MRNPFYPNVLSEEEQKLLAVFLSHVKDAVEQVKDDVRGRKVLKTVSEKDQKPFSFEDLYRDAFYEDRWEKQKKAVVVPLLPATSTAAASSTAADNAATTGISHNTTNQSPAINIADMALDLLYDEIQLDAKGQAKIRLAPDDLKRDWTIGMKKIGDFSEKGINFIIALQQHLKERNPSYGESLVNDLDFSDGPVPLFFYFIANTIKVACSNIDSMPLRSHYLLSLIRYSMSNVIMERNVTPGAQWYHKEGGQVLKAFLVTMDEVNLKPMDNAVRKTLANQHAPELIKSLKEHDNFVRSKLIQLLFTLFYQGKDNNPKDKDYIPHLWSTHQEQCAEAMKNGDEVNKEINLLMLMMIMQIQANNGYKLTASVQAPAVSSSSSSSPIVSESKMMDKYTAQDDSDEEYVSDQEDQEDDDEDDEKAATSSQQQLAQQDAQDKVLVKYEGNVVPMRVHPNSVATPPLLAQKEHVKITCMMKQVLPISLKLKTLNIDGDELNAQQLVRLGLINPKSPYFNADEEGNLNTWMLPWQTGGRLYIQLLKNNSGIPHHLIAEEIKTLQEGGDSLRQNLIIANWLLVRMISLWYYLHAERLTLTHQCAQTGGEWTLFVILAGPTHAGFRLMEEAIIRLKIALTLLENSVKHYIFRLAKKKQDIPKEWDYHLKSSGKILRDIQNALENELQLLRDLQVIAEQWKSDPGGKAAEMKKLFQYYGEKVKFDIKMMSEFMNEETITGIRQLDESQDSHQRARHVEAFMQQLQAAPVEKISLKEQRKLAEEGVSGGRTEGLMPDMMRGDVLNRASLTPAAKKSALENAKNRNRARQKLEELRLLAEEKLRNERESDLALSNTNPSMQAAVLPAATRQRVVAIPQRSTAAVGSSHHGASSTAGSSSTTTSNDTDFSFGLW